MISKILTMSLLTGLSFAESASSATGVASSDAPTSSGVPAAANGLPTDGSIVFGYYSNWVPLTAVPLESIPYKDLTVLSYFVAPVGQDGTIDTTTIISPTQGLQIVSDTARKANPTIKMCLSVFGWSGSQYASAVFADKTKSDALVQSLVGLYNQYKLEMIELDYEFPANSANNTSGAPCNVVGDHDVDNFLAFIKSLRGALPKGALLSIALGAGQVWPDATGAPAASAKDFASVLDTILIMDYDVANPLANKALKNSGPNSPLKSDQCAPAGKAWGKASLEDAVQSWTTAGFKSTQILAGVSAYGRKWTLTETPNVDSIYFDGMLAAGDTIAQPGGEKQATDNCPGSPKVDIGIWFYPSIVDTILPQSGWQRFLDPCTSTTTLINAQAKSLLTYEDPQSICLKKQYIKKMSLAGIGFFDFRGLDSGNGTFLKALTSSPEDCSQANFPGKALTVQPKGSKNETTTSSGADSSYTAPSQSTAAPSSSNAASSSSSSSFSLASAAVSSSSKNAAYSVKLIIGLLGAGQAGLLLNRHRMPYL